MFVLSFLCGVNSATGGLYDYNFVHLIAHRNRNRYIVAAPMPTVQAKIVPPLWRTISQQIPINSNEIAHPSRRRLSPPNPWPPKMSRLPATL